MVNIKEYALLVAKTRKAQKGFFQADKNSATRQQFLELSKKLEKELDKQTEKILDNQITIDL